MMNIAVFADVHGRIHLCLKLCVRWQRETGERLDLILQAGDMGVFPERSRLDRATLAHAHHDPTELGFMTSFARYDPRVATVLAELRCDLVFVRGNHEDHVWLDDLESHASAPIYPVDVYKRIYSLKTGDPYTFDKNGEKLTILGIGRIGQPNASRFSTESLYIQPEEIARLFRRKKLARTDVLLTHDMAAPDVRQGEVAALTKGGMKEIREALNYYVPAYHFHGHIGGPLYADRDANGGTDVYKLTDLHWTQDSRQVVQPDSMGILRWQDADHHTFEIVREPWLQEYTAYTWEYLD